MNVRPWNAISSAAQDLSKAPGFVLGPLSIDPPTRRASGYGRTEVLEPRVMRVLVALAEAQGGVLSRDDLIALCWDGTIVGDNAINRVISLLRQALTRLAPDALRLETITKVGFRLVEDPAAAAASSPAPPVPAEPARPRLVERVGRRGLLAGGALLAAAVATGGYAALNTRAHVPDPRAVHLTREADRLMKSGLPGSTRQAIHYLEQAVEIDPRYATGWGQLAGMYRHAIQGFSEGERQSYPRMVRSAAQRALALEPGQPDAELALAVMRPFAGRWSEAEPALRAIQAAHPRHWYANGQLSLLLMDVGRFEDALRFRQQVIAIDDAIPVAWGFLALNQLLADRIHEADRSLDRASRVWPAQPFLWFVRYQVLLHSGRPAAAASFARDVRFRPDGFPEEFVGRSVRVAEAIAGTDRAARSRAVQEVVAAMDYPEAAADDAPVLALLDEPELALAASAGFFAGGRFADHEWPAPGEFDNRPAYSLYYPALLALRAEPGFAEILDHSGLESYWRQSGSQPDFRRG